MRAVGIHRGGWWLAALAAAGCNDRVVVPGYEWPSPLEITRRIDDNCIVVDGTARCWAYETPSGLNGEELGRDEERDRDTLMLMLRDELFPGSPLPPLDVGSGARLGALATGGRETRCGTIEGVGVRCWGDNGGADPVATFKH